MIILARHKKILVSVPDALLTEVDSLATKQNLNRSEFIRLAMRQYIIQSQKNEMALMMKKGYEEMSQINLEISEYCLGADDNALRFYEEKLAECE